jgi:putative ABC transport system substrate-binding protein
MHRRTIGLILTLALGLALFAAGGQPLGKVPCIGLLAIGFAPSTPDWQQHNPFLQALRELGYADGQSIILEARWAEGHAERLPALATALVRVWVDVIVPDGLPAAQVAMDARVGADFAATRGPPGMGPKWLVDVGGLLAYTAAPVKRDQRTAAYVDWSPKGAKPAELPMERPMQFELVINLQTAQALGLTIPPTLLVQATEVIR